VSSVPFSPHAALAVASATAAAADNPADRGAVGPYGFDRKAIEWVVSAARDAWLTH
jgi:hypothetical protein